MLQCWSWPQSNWECHVHSKTQLTLSDALFHFRIPLHLFPIETQNRILEVGEDTKVEDTTEEVQEVAKVVAKEEVQEEKYVDASSFRQAPAAPSGLSHSELSLR